MQNVPAETVPAGQAEHWGVCPRQQRQGSVASAHGTTSHIAFGPEQAGRVTANPFTSTIIGVLASHKA